MTDCPHDPVIPSWKFLRKLCMVPAKRYLKLVRSMPNHIDKVLDVYTNENITLT